MSLLKDKAVINGEWVNAVSNKKFEVYNPANGKLVGTAPNMDAVDAEKAIKAAHEAFKTWQNTTGQERGGLLKKWHDLLEANSAEIGKIAGQETGRDDSTFDIVGGNEGIEYYAAEARRIQGEIISSPYPDKKMFVERQPIGVVGLITPWNAPYFTVVRKMAPALAAGCTIVLKPAEDTPLTALAAIHLAHEAGFPKGVINVVTCARENASAIGKAICGSPLVGGISFTGSTAVGKILYGQCASQIKRVAMELGGNSPFIVFKSANLDVTAHIASALKFMICGQGCVLPNRYLIQEDVFDEFVKKFIEVAKTVKLDPLINATQFKRLSGLVDDARGKGAKILLGGKPDTAKGKLYYEPTVIVETTKDMRVYQEEIFGPVACFMKFKTEEEAIEVANDTEKGLASYFYTQDIAQIFRVSKQLQTGVVSINSPVLLPVEAPFGGIKESGIGKEGSPHGIDEFCYLKYVCLGGL